MDRKPRLSPRASNMVARQQQQQRSSSSFRGASNSYHNSARNQSYGQQQGYGGGRRSTTPRVVVQRRAAPVDAIDQVNLSFGNFEFQEMKSVGQRGGGVRELHTLLRRARRQAVTHQSMMKSEEGIAERNDDLLRTALDRASGIKIKDDPTRIAKALAKRRNMKRRSAKKWEQRRKNLIDSVDSVVKDRSVEKQAMKAKRTAKKDKKSAGKGKDAKKGSKGGPKKSAGGRGGGRGGGGRGGGGRGGSGGRGGKSGGRGGGGRGGGRGGGGRGRK